MPGKVGVDLQTCYAVQSASASSTSDRTLSVASHIAENITPMKNAPKRLSTGNKEGIAPGGIDCERGEGMVSERC